MSTTTDTPILTRREQEVADQITLGRTNKEIAKALGISYETVKEHVQHILAKYGVPRRELIAIKQLREQLSAELLGQEFIAAFERRSTAIEKLAEQMVEETARMRMLVASAVRKSVRKAGAA